MSLIKVNEIFCSIQGESTFAGLPCVFVRLTGCSIRCSYCDTKYAYEEGEEIELEAILAKVREFGLSLVAVTGGEPLEAEGVKDLLNALVNENFNVLLETSGIPPLEGIPDAVTVVMDIKCPASGVSIRTCWKNLDALSLNDQIKFVISDEADFRWAVNIARKYDLINRCPVLFSPAAPRLAPSLLAKWILNERLAVRLQPQLHKIIYAGPGPG